MVYNIYRKNSLLSSRLGIASWDFFICHGGGLASFISHGAHLRGHARFKRTHACMRTLACIWCGEDTRTHACIHVSIPSLPWQTHWSVFQHRGNMQNGIYLCRPGYICISVHIFRFIHVAMFLKLGYFLTFRM